jgi:hypothetical protein
MHRHKGTRVEFPFMVAYGRVDGTFPNIIFRDGSGTTIGGAYRRGAQFGRGVVAHITWLHELFASKFV